MTFYYDDAQHPTMILDKETRRKLLIAIQSGQIDMAHFPELYHPNNRNRTLESYDLPEEEVQRANGLMRKIKRSADGQIILTRELKIRLLNAIRANEINLLSDFPELAKAYQAVEQDWSDLTDEEQGVLMDFIRKLN